MTTVQRITLALSKEDKRILDELCDKLGETKSAVIKRSLMSYYSKTENKNIMDGVGRE